MVPSYEIATITIHVRKHYRQRSRNLDKPSPLRILVVEDQQDAADSMAMLLGLWGYELTIAHEGERACEVATSLALTDRG